MRMILREFQGVEHWMRGKADSPADTKEVLSSRIKAAMDPPSKQVDSTVAPPSTITCSRTRSRRKWTPYRRLATTWTHGR